MKKELFFFRNQTNEYFGTDTVENLTECLLNRIVEFYIHWVIHWNNRYRNQITFFKHNQIIIVQKKFFCLRLIYPSLWSAVVLFWIANFSVYFLLPFFYVDECKQKFRRINSVLKDSTVISETDVEKRKICG